jgi:hypothetical protein
MLSLFSGFLRGSKGDPSSEEVNFFNVKMDIKLVNYLRKCCKEEGHPEPLEEKPIVEENQNDQKETFFVDMDDIVVNKAESEKLEEEEEKEQCIQLIIDESDNRGLIGELNFDKRTEEELRTPRSEINKDYYEQNFNNNNNNNFKPILELERNLNLDRFSDEENDLNIECQIEEQKKSDIDPEEKLDFDQCSKGLDYDLHHQQVFHEKDRISLFNSGIKSPEPNNIEKEYFKEEGTPNSNQPNSNFLPPTDGFSIDSKMNVFPQRQLRAKRTPTDYYLG